MEHAEGSTPVEPHLLIQKTDARTIQCFPDVNVLDGRPSFLWAKHEDDNRNALPKHPFGRLEGVKNMKRVGNWIWNFLCKIATGIIKVARPVRDALTVGNAPCNLGITDQTVTKVASAAVPIVLPPGTAESLGICAQHLAFSASLWLTKHGLTAAGWITFKVSIVPAFVVGSAIATCGIAILLLCGIRFLQQRSPRLSPFSRSVDDVRTSIEWFKSIFSFAD